MNNKKGKKSTLALVKTNITNIFAAAKAMNGGLILTFPSKIR
jgi:hypothetical protein